MKIKNAINRLTLRGVCRFQALSAHAISQTLEIVPKRLKPIVGVALLAPLPAFARDYGDPPSGGISDLLNKVESNFGTIKKFMWALATLIGIVVAAWGFVMMAVVGNTNYSGKTRLSHCWWAVVCGVIAAAASIYFGYIAHTIGADDAVNNETNDSPDFDD